MSEPNPENLPRAERELLQLRKESEAFDKERQALAAEIDRLKQENELFRKALLEVEAEKATIAYNQLGSSLRIRMLLQGPGDEGRV